MKHEAHEEHEGEAAPVEDEEEMFLIFLRVPQEGLGCAPATAHHAWKRLKHGVHEEHEEHEGEAASAEDEEGKMLLIFIRAALDLPSCCF